MELCYRSDKYQSTSAIKVRRPQAEKMPVIYGGLTASEKWQTFTKSETAGICIDNTLLQDVYTRDAWIVLYCEQSN